MYPLEQNTSHNVYRPENSVDLRRWTRSACHLPDKRLLRHSRTRCLYPHVQIVQLPFLSQCCPPAGPLVLGVRHLLIENNPIVLWMMSQAEAKGFESLSRTWKFRSNARPLSSSPCTCWAPSTLISVVIAAQYFCACSWVSCFRDFLYEGIFG